MRRLKIDRLSIDRWAEEPNLQGTYQKTNTICEKNVKLKAGADRQWRFHRPVKQGYNRKSCFDVEITQTEIYVLCANDLSDKAHLHYS